MEYDYAVFIGRFQPFHNGHKAVVDKALTLAKRVIILVGSANLGRSIRNPFTYEERKHFIEVAYSGTGNDDRLIIIPLDDFTYDNNGWIEQVQSRVAAVVKKIEDKGWEDYVTWGDKSVGRRKVTLIGRNKDNSSFYLKLFPNWDANDVFEEDVKFLNATDIRNAMFEAKTPALFCARKESQLVPVEVFNELAAFLKTDFFKEIVEEHEWCVKYKEPYANLPYEPTFNTTDAVIRASGHILLVKRKANPGKGLWALPGGFLNPKETLFECCLRETFEETRLAKAYDTYLKRSYKTQHTFDDPYRDPRGRFITEAFYFDMGDLPELPLVRGGSDAKKAQWIPIAELRADNMYADHYFIIRKLLKQST